MQVGAARTVHVLCLLLKNNNIKSLLRVCMLRAMMPGLCSKSLLLVVVS